TRPAFDQEARRTARRNDPHRQQARRGHHGKRHPASIALVRRAPAARRRAVTRRRAVSAEALPYGSLPYLRMAAQSRSCGRAWTVWPLKPVVVSPATMAFKIASSVASAAAWNSGVI